MTETWKMDMRSLHRSLASALAIVVVPATIAACSDNPQPQVPTQPTVAGANPNPGQAQFSMSDTPSSVRVGELPEQAPRTALTGQAAGIYQQALQAFSNGDMATAKGLFEQATQADPRSHQAFYSLGVVQERLKDPGASASYRQAYTLVPDYEPAIIAYAMLQARKGNLSEAERFLSEKRGQMPKSAAVAATLAEVKSLQKDTGSAQRIAQEALKINPDYRPAMVIIARDHYRNRRLDLALYALQAILDGFGDENPPRDKDNGEAFLLRGLILREQGNRVGALDQFTKAVQRRPDLVEARVQLGAALVQAGNAPEAAQMLEGAVRYDPDNVGARLNLGDAYRLLGKYAEAKREFEWVLARDSSMPQVHYDLALLYLYAPSVPGMTAKQQIGEAIRELTKYREVRPRDIKDDSEELLNAAKIKEGEINAANAPAAPPPTPPAGTGTPATPPAGTGAPAPGAPGAPAPGAPAPGAPAPGAPAPGAPAPGAPAPGAPGAPAPGAPAPGAPPPAAPPAN
ncbi:MAG: tetratricopeptide repeat protein [Minicystis sp.]